MSTWTPQLSFLSSASVSNGGVAYNAWTNHANALSVNADYAYSILYGVDQSYRLNLTNLSGVAAAIPIGSTIGSLLSSCGLEPNTLNYSWR